MNIYNKKLVDMIHVYNKLGKKHTFLIYVSVQEFNILKFYSVQVYMHPKVCKREYFDLIIKLFKYKCETY